MNDQLKAFAEKHPNLEKIARQTANSISDAVQIAIFVGGVYVGVAVVKLVAKKIVEL